MGRAKRTQPEQDPGPVVDLSEIIPARVSHKAKQLVRERARRAGVSPSIWVRQTIYKALGLSKE
jgi:hypothetical protein